MKNAVILIVAAGSLLAHAQTAAQSSSPDNMFIWTFRSPGSNNH
jgi:hypothetical protein